MKTSFKIKYFNSNISDGKWSLTVCLIPSSSSLFSDFCVFVTAQTNFKVLQKRKRVFKNTIKKLKHFTLGSISNLKIFFILTINRNFNDNLSHDFLMVSILHCIRYITSISSQNKTTCWILKDKQT